jgi:hypothetical protein
MAGIDIQDMTRAELEKAQEKEAKAFTGNQELTAQKLWDKKLEYTGINLYFRFNAAGQLEVIQLLQWGASVEELITEATDIIRQYHSDLEKIDQKVRLSLQDLLKKLPLLSNMCQSNAALDALKKKHLSVLLKAYFLSENDARNNLTLTISLSEKDFGILPLRQAMSVTDCVNSLAEAYQKLTQRLVKEQKELFRVMGTDTMTEKAFDQLLQARSAAPLNPALQFDITHMKEG